jgi:hypothetical protein
MGLEPQCQSTSTYRPSFLFLALYSKVFLKYTPASKISKHGLSSWCHHNWCQNYTAWWQANWLQDICAVGHVVSTWRRSWNHRSWRQDHWRHASYMWVPTGPFFLSSLLPLSCSLSSLYLPPNLTSADRRARPVNRAASAQPAPPRHASHRAP